METDAAKWLEDAISAAVRAKEKGITVMLVRRYENQPEYQPDYIVTNATDTDMVGALAHLTRELARKEEY